MDFNNIWRLLLLKGIVFIIFGFIAIIWTGITLAALTFVFALLILLSGIFNLVSGIISISHPQKHWLLTIIVGIIETGVGVYALGHPGMSLAVLIFLIGFTFIIRGIFEIAAAFDHAYGKSHKALSIFGGILGILAGIAILTYPVAGGLAFIWILGLYAMVIGSIYVVLSLMARKTLNNTI